MERTNLHFRLMFVVDSDKTATYMCYMSMHGNKSVSALANKSM